MAMVMMMLVLVLVGKPSPPPSSQNHASPRCDITRVPRLALRLVGLTADLSAISPSLRTTRRSLNLMRSVGFSHRAYTEESIWTACLERMLGTRDPGSVQRPTASEELGSFDQKEGEEVGRSIGAAYSWTFKKGDARGYAEHQTHAREPGFWPDAELR